jgi:hypothetical protein
MNQTSLQEMDIENRFEINLTHEQFKKLQKILPMGYSLTVSNKNTRLARKIAKSSLYDANNRKRRRKISGNEEPIFEGEIDLKKCLKILQVLKQDPSSEPFLRPVDPEALRIPQYYDIIREPMDISTVESNLKSNKYFNKEQFERDVNLIWENACKFNLPETQVHKMAVYMREEFDKIKDQEFLEGLPRKKSLIKRPENWNRKNKMSEPKALTLNEQRILSSKIKELAPEDLWGVWNIVQTDKKERDEELEFNIATLPPKKARELQKYVNSKFVQTGIKKKLKPYTVKKNVDYIPTNENYPHEAFNEDQKQMPIHHQIPIVPIGNQNIVKPVNQDSSNSSFISDLESDN